MAPGRHDITIRRGETWEEVWTWTDDDDVPFDLTGYVASIEFRTAPGGTVALRLTSPSGGITLGGTAGTIAVVASDEQTAALDKAKYRWDARLEDASDVVTYLLAGSVTVVDAITAT